MTLLQQLTEDAHERQLISSRLLKAPGTLVFSAWTTPEYLAQWWGPKGFTNTFQKFEPVHGGEWKYMMHGPNGGHYPNESRFLEVSANRIVIHHISNPKFYLIATFEEKDHERTRITFRQVFETEEDFNKVKVFAVDANEENLDRLEMVLHQLTGERKLLLTKTFVVA